MSQGRRPKPNSAISVKGVTSKLVDKTVEEVTSELAKKISVVILAALNPVLMFLLDLLPSLPEAFTCALPVTLTVILLVTDRWGYMARFLLAMAILVTGNLLGLAMGTGGLSNAFEHGGNLFTIAGRLLANYILQYPKACFWSAIVGLGLGGADRFLRRPSLPQKTRSQD